MKVDFKKVTVVISLIFLSLIAVLTLVYYTGESFEEKVHESLVQFNQSQDYKEKLAAYDKLENDYHNWQLILSINQKSKAEYENAKYEMKTNFEKRFLYLASLISDQKNKIENESEDIQSQEKSDIESNLQQQINTFKDEVKYNKAFSEEEKARLIYSLDAKKS